MKKTGWSMVDGLDPNAGDVRHPGDYIEDEMIPYINQAFQEKRCIRRTLLIRHKSYFHSLLSYNGRFNGRFGWNSWCFMHWNGYAVCEWAGKANKKHPFMLELYGRIMCCLLCAVCFIGYKEKRNEIEQQTLLLREAAEKQRPQTEQNHPSYLTCHDHLWILLSDLRMVLEPDKYLKLR